MQALFCFGAVFYEQLLKKTVFVHKLQDGRRPLAKIATGLWRVFSDKVVPVGSWANLRIVAGLRLLARPSAGAGRVGGTGFGCPLASTPH